jgi:hypothetical protein
LLTENSENVQQGVVDVVVFFSLMGFGRRNDAPGNREKTNEHQQYSRYSPPEFRGER